MDSHDDRHAIKMQVAEHQLPMSFKSSRYVRRTQRNSIKRKKQDDKVADAIKKMFGKYYEIDNRDCNLPAKDTFFTEDSWMVEDLQKLKADLNEMKSKLNDCNLMKWRYHTRRRNHAGHIIWQVREEINPELLTQAWCKFYENLSSFELIPAKSFQMKQLKSIHLCEAPGAFIAALNHWLKLNASSINWDWTATTLNPNYEGNSLSVMLNDDRFISHTMNNWYFGVDNTGDLMKLQNLDAIVKMEQENRDKILLITADGSIDCFSTPGEQETFVSHLHYCEMIAALHLLSKGGNFLIKLFTIFECQTVCLMYLLSCCFKKISINKPATSKGGNSEVYIVCLNFKGLDYVATHLGKLREHYESFTDKAMFRRDDIPSSFIQQIIHSGSLYKSYQCEVISDNIETFSSMTDESYMDVKKIRKGIADYFIKHCNLAKLPSESMRILGSNVMDQTCHNILDDKRYYNSYNDRQLKDNMRPETRLSILMDDLKFINAVNQTSCSQFTEDNLETLRISTAIPYENIQSSKFCQPKILKVYSLASEIIKKSVNDWQYPNYEAVERFVNIETECKFLCFQYTLKYDGFNVIEKIHEALANLELDQTLVLIGYSLLTQFNVGIFYILAHTFKSVEMQVVDELGCVIKLHNYIKRERMIEFLNDIFDASIIAKNDNKIIISVISVVQLNDSNLYPKLLEVNHAIIKHFVHRVIMEINSLSE